MRPNFLDLYKTTTGEKTPEGTPEGRPEEQQPQFQTTEEQIASNPQFGSPQETPETVEEGTMSMPENIPGTLEEQQSRENQMMDEQMLGKGVGRNKKLEAEPDSWGPEYTARGYLTESANSLARGIGKHLIAGTGDMMQAAGAIAGLDPKGNWATNLLQETGAEMSHEFRALIPEELQHENLTFSSMADPKFWSIHAAEMVPQLVEFIMLSKGGAALAKKGVAKAAQGISKKTGILGKVGAVTEGSGVAAGEVLGTGKGVLGALATEAGMTQLGGNVVGALGGGITGNVFSGMLNAAQAINENKDLRDENDQLMFNDEELSQIAGSTMRNNSAWLGMDILSYGFTYGKLGNIFKGAGKGVSNAVSKGANSTKVGKEIFKYDIAPIFKGLARVSKKAGMEGVEETFQETFEEWAKKKAVADHTSGFFSEDLADVPEFFDFYKSKENRGTLVLSAAMGALGGGAGNISQLFNQKANEAYNIQNKMESFKNMKNKQGTAHEQTWQNRHIHQQIADIIIDDRVGLYDDFSQKLVANENITEEEKKYYDNLLVEMQEVKAKAKRLNVKGVNALLHHKADENFFSKKMESVIANSQEKLDAYTEMFKDENVDPREVKKKMKEEEDSFNQVFGALSIKHARAIQNQQNLILGKKAIANDVEITLDKYGNEIIIDGLSTQDYEAYVKDAEQSGVVGKVKRKFEMPSMNSLTRSAKEAIKKARENYNVFRQPTEVQDGDGNVINEEAKQLKESAATADVQGSGETEINGQKVQTPNSASQEQAKEKANSITQEEADSQAEEMGDNATVSADEVISESDWKEFNDGSTVSQGMIDDIAQAIHTNDSLSERQEEIRGKNRERVKKAISKRILRTTDVSEAARSKTYQTDEISEKAKRDQEKERIAEVRDRFRDTLGGLKRKFKESKKAWRKRVKPDLDKFKEETGEELNPQQLKMLADGTLDAEFEVLSDDDLSNEEVDYVDAEVDTPVTGKTVKKAAHEKRKDFAKNFKVNPNRTVDAENFIGRDKRNDESNILMQNLQEAQALEGFFKKMRRRKLTSGVHISQNELDNYLNRMSTFNEFGPSAVDKMMAVNHNLKNMFPNMKYPTQVYIVDNLYHSLGSVGLGMALAGTIFIDEKAWEQDSVFMHELSHIYYQLSKDEPETQKLVSEMLRKDKDLLAKTKELYDDYILYDVIKSDGTFVRADKRKILNQMRTRPNWHPDNANKIIADEIAKGRMKTVPTSQQEGIIEEMFAAKLEGPLSSKYDKVFKGKDEPKRQQDTKIWWGMLRKKGKLIEENNGMEQMLNKLYENGTPSGDLKTYVFNVFKAATEGQALNYAAMDKRADNYTQEVINQHNDISVRLKQERAKGKPQVSSAKDSEFDYIDDYESGLETQGTAFYNKNYNDQAKGASKIMRRFGAVYNKALRKRFIKDSNGKVVDWKIAPIFDRDIFESVVYNLATENGNVREFIRQIEQSELQEVQAFNRYLDKIHPDSKLQMLTGMHMVFSNSKHIVGVRNTMKDGRHWMQDSLSLREQNKVDRIVENMTKNYNKSTKMKNFNVAVDAIYNGSNDTEHYLNILRAVTDHTVNIDKIQEQGYVTFQGVNIPLDTLIAGYVKKGLMFRRNKDGSRQEGKIYVGEARPLIEAIINTNRKFTPSSMVQNAEGNYEPVRITNNHLTKEVDAIIDFLQGDENGYMPTIDEFLQRFSHINEKNKKIDGRKYVANQFLENIYFDFHRGIKPQITQYHGLSDISNNKGSLYKNSTALEQGIEDFMMYAGSARTENGKKNRQFLANLGTFSDSPRKFFMNMNRIDHSDIWETKNGQQQFKGDGTTINSLYNLYRDVNPGSKFASSKASFKAGLNKAIREEKDFLKENAKELSKLAQMQRYFTNGKLNKEGEMLSEEYVVNSIAAGLNVSDVFLPGVENDAIVKRMKANSSPIFSAKNENFKVEPLFYADELINGKESGTDSGMYILKEDAVKLQNLGRGIFDMNDGFKILNSSIEKDNKNFKGKMAYLKGYTTIIDKGHPLYDALKARKDKYNAYHKAKFGVEPSVDLNDGTFNHLVIAVPQSSDKSNFMKKKYHDKGQYTDTGLKMSPAHISNNLEEMNKIQDADYYENGEFVGISSYNFGPQQVMDKVTKVANTPVQMENSIIVNAAGVNMSLALEIQEHISNQKRDKLEETLKKIASKSPADYKRFIEKSLNKDDMDQIQRILLEDGGSLAHPAINEIVVNQLAKSLRRDGNKLETPGTNAHQKPDIGYEAAGGKKGQRLKGYQKQANGALKAMEIILPNHMKNDSKNQPRKDFNRNTHSLPSNITKDEALAKLKSYAMKEATHRAKKYTNTTAESLVTEVTNEAGYVTGYQVRGDLVIASRVPGHGPSSTGVFEVLGFDETTDGNQVMVPSEFNEIIGADNDGDSLFIQTLGNPAEFNEWNQAFNKLTQYWLSPAMAEQIQATMDFEDETREMIKQEFPGESEKSLQFSPSGRRVDYNNTMVSQRNISPVFSTHKVTNMLAAYEIGFSKPISLNGNEIKAFRDYGIGNTSRNQRSAILANIVLDNAKHGFADTLGIDEHNISQAVLMINMGFSLKEVGKLLNSPAAKEWSNQNRKNSSSYHEGISRAKIAQAIYKKLDLGKKRAKFDKFNFNFNEGMNDKKQQAQIVEFFSYLSDMNSEVQQVSSIMSGHNKIHVNPLVLQKQLDEYEQTIDNKNEDQVLAFTDEFKKNPNIQNYVEVARKTLDHTKTLNPIYRDSTNKVMQNIEAKLGRELNAKQIEEISLGIKKFNASRLIGLNNSDYARTKDLLSDDLSNKNSIFNKMNSYVSSLRGNVLKKGENNNVYKDINAFDNSILFRKALNLNLSGNAMYISMNPEFANESFTKEERERAQREFEELPPALQDDLMLYDLIKTGWAGKTSMSALFGREANFFINMASDHDLANKNAEISPKVTKELERIMMLKENRKSSNSLIKAYAEPGDTSLDAIMKNKEVQNHLKIKGSPLYVSVIKNNQKFLFEMQPMTKAELTDPGMMDIARNKFKWVKDDLSSNVDMDLALIADNNIGGFKFRNTNNSEENVSMNPLVEATIDYEEAFGALGDRVANDDSVYGKEAREDYDAEVFSKADPLTEVQFEQAMEYEPFVSKAIRQRAYNEYLKEKEAANKESKKVLTNLEQKSQEELLDMYQAYGTKNVYAYSVILTPVLKQLAARMGDSQAKLWKDNNVEGKGYDGKDVSKIQAYLMGGSTIPSNHPTSQAMARILETEYKKFINEKTKRISEMNKITEKLYKKKLGYGTSKFLDKLRMLRDALFVPRDVVYEKLYGNIVSREPKTDPKTGKVTYDFKLKTEAEIGRGVASGTISKEEKDFYDFFKKTTQELMPEKVKNKKEDYIPHSSMSKFESFANRGLLGLMISSRSDNEALYDVKMYFKELDGKQKLMTFKNVEDVFKGSAAGQGKNDIKRMAEYREMKRKAQKLLKSGKNEDGSEIRTSGNLTETALGFGAMNRFTNNRSVSATEMPSMDLNKALGDYIHSSIFVNGAGDFKGMEKLQGLIDASLAFNRENNLTNMNDHVQKVWKDYFLRGKRQESVLGKKADSVIRGLTRLNLFYALGYKANTQTGGLYAIGNVLVGKYHNIKDIGGKAWIDGEKKFWGLDKGFEGGLEGIYQRHKRMSKIMKNLNFMDINIYDEVNIEKNNGVDGIFSKIALGPMIYSEKWIQNVHMIGLLSQEELDKFDENGDYKPGESKVQESRLVALEDQVKSSHGRGYQPTDQRAIQMYSWGNMILQFSKFIPTMVQDRFAKKDVNSYGQEHVGSLRLAGQMVRNVLNNPKDFVKYRNSLSEYERKRLDSALRGMAMSAVIGIGGAALASDTLDDLYGDANYYMNYGKLSNKAVPPAIQSTNNFISELF